METVSKAARPKIKLGADAGSKRKLGTEHVADDELEAIVFGKSFLKSRVQGTEIAEADDKVALKAKKTRKTGEVARAAATDGASEEEKEDNVQSTGAAWCDPDDATLEVDLSRQRRTMKLRTARDDDIVNGVEYERRLRNQFVKLHGYASWAEEKKTDSEAESDLEEVIPTSAQIAVRQKGGALRPTEIDVGRLKDIRFETPQGETCPAVVKALQFHPTSDLMMTAGLDKRVNFINVDGEDNPKVASYFFEKFPIKEASFTPNGDHVLLTGRDHNMYNLDVRTGESRTIRPLTSQVHSRVYGLAVGPNAEQCPGSRASKLFCVLGDAGTIVIGDADTKHPVRTLRMASDGKVALFSTARDTVITADSEANLYEWDLGTGKCMQRIKDPWATGITSLAMRRESKYSPKPILAVGTQTGNIDLYDLSLPRLSKEPYKSIQNLTTASSLLRFHPEGELLLAASNTKKDAFKLVHANTATVYQNWPTNSTPLHKVSAADFSRSGGFMAIGNEKGRVLLYRLGHYELAR